MKVAVLNTSVPFLRGGAEELADALVRALISRGDDVELVKVPLRWETAEDVMQSMLAAVSLRIVNADRVIALKFPAYLVPHDNKVIWLLHQFRQVYDLWDREGQASDTGAWSRLAEAVRRADEVAFSESREIYCNSAVTQGRLANFNGVTGKILLQPHPNAGAFRTGSYGDYILAIGRINQAKRQEMLVEAFGHVSQDIRLVIAGAPETEQDLKVLSEAIDRSGSGSRVDVIPRFISEDEKVELLAGARAVAYIPFDEDSYSYVALEAFLSGKPVITTADSGGVLELVGNLVTGLVAEPSPEAIARAVDILVDDRLAEELGREGLARVRALELSWQSTVERLLA